MKTPIRACWQFQTFMIIHTLCNQTNTSHLLGLATTAEKLGLSKPFIYLDKSFIIRYYLINKKKISVGTKMHKVRVYIL